MMRWMWRSACLLLLATTAEAGTIYVNNVTGSNRANGLFPEVASAADGPVATIARALEIVLPFDSIVIANTGVPYHESIILNGPRPSGTEKYPVIIEGNNALIRGTRPLPYEVWRPVSDGTHRYQPLRKGHYQLIVNGSPAQEVRVERDDAAPPYLQPLQWAAFRGFVYFRAEPQKFIDQYEIEVPALEVGLALHNVRHVIVRNLQIEGFRLDGVSVSGCSHDVRLVNIRSTANGRAGLAATGTARVAVGGLNLAGNRVAERLELLKAQITDLPAEQVPAPPAPVTWNLDDGRYVRILGEDESRAATATARSPIETR